MIGIVVVSHSRALARAAISLASEMAAGDGGPPVRVAAGLDEETLGTDATAVAEAIEEVAATDGVDGVLVLLDLGSAVLSAEMALELVEPDVAERVRLCGAPLVEGLVAAVVSAAGGAPMDAVAAEAEDGLLAKRTHLGEQGDGSDGDGGGPGPGVGGPPAPGAGGGPAESVELVVPNPHGLHARPAAQLVRLVAGHDADVRVTNLDSGRGPVAASSLSRVATLDAREGHRLRFEATGPDAGAVLRAVEAFAAEDFGDAPGRPATGVGTGDAGTPGAEAVRGSGLDAAVGTALVVEHDVDTSGYEPGSPDVEGSRLADAVEAARAELADIGERAAAAAGADAGAILAAQTALLDDPEVMTPVRTAVAAGRSAPDAWGDRLAEVEAGFAELGDAYQRERGQDVGSVRRVVLAALVGRPGTAPEEAGPSTVLVVPELDAATAARVDAGAVVGIVAVGGGATGHGVIVARSRGIPVLTDAGDPARSVRTGDVVAFDARTRRLDVRPGPEVVAELGRLLDARRAEREDAEAAATEPATTTDGLTVSVLANVTSVDDARAAVEAGADGSGLVRTEVLFGAWGSAPSADEQAAALADVATALGDRPMTVRTWDVGGDKPLPFIPAEPEANPFLGVRGVRAFREDPGVLDTQLEAVCRVAAEHPVRVMFPMVATVEEVEWCLARLDAAADRATGGRPDGLDVGIMVEVPAAALRAGALTASLDFVSIGTNDLTQYVLAAERGNGALSALADPLDPAVLRLVGTVCREVRDGVEVAVCGGAASDPETAGLLVGLGVRELSATAPAVPLVKAHLRACSLDDLEALGRAAEAASSVAEVRALLAQRTRP